MTLATQTDDVPARGFGVYWILLTVAGVVGMVVLGGMWISGTTIIPPPLNNKASKQDPLQLIREDLNKSTDLRACRAARDALNRYVQDDHTRIPALTDKQTQVFTGQLHLDDGELKEVQSRLFTPLDDYHLELCFLMRDAAQALEVEDLLPLEQAERAFGWVVRQFNVRENASEALPFVVPPALVLHRGWGSSLERGLIFLELLRQLGLEGCLIAPAGKPLTPWGCGVLINDGSKPSLALFDPRLGLPIPGADGKGIATLELAQTQPAILEQLTVDPKLPYDINMKGAASSEIYLAPSLSAVAPRMEILQNQFLGNNVRVNLAADPSQALERFEKAGGKTPVKFAHELLSLTRRFLPPEDGGTDNSKQIMSRVLYGGSMQSLPAPVILRDFPTVMANEYLQFYLSMYVAFYVEYEQPRDTVLRGRFTKATDKLVKQMDHFKDAKEQYASRKDELEGSLKTWIPRFIEAKAHTVQFPQDAEARESLNTIRKDGEKDLIVALTGEAAEPMVAEATYQMALCMQELAERRQARLERLTKSGKVTEAETAKAKEVWATALTWWQSYLDKFDAAPLLPWARLHKARCLEAVNDKEKARSLLQSVREPISPLEQVGCRYRANSLK